MRRGRFILTAAVCMTLLALPAVSLAENAALGDVHFQTSCRPEVQSRFDHGVALLHSFEFREAEEAFHQLEKEDPKCVIAAWGIALSKTERAGADAPKKDLAAGWAEFQPWLAIKAGTEREQMYVDSVRAMYEGYDKTSGEDRWRKYLAGMQAIRRQHPDDVNASLFYGLGLVWTAGSGQAGLAQRQKALSIFLPIFAQYPKNPGAAHYIIHAADTAELAPQALAAARAYAAIAPDSPHALHMPSHIFNRLGYWSESIRTNQASARAADEWMKTDKDGRFDELHALNNIEYGYLQLGRDQEAQKVIEQIDALGKTGSDVWLSIDARIYYDLETHDWSDAVTIEPPAESKFEENFDAYWIQTIAAAHLGDPRKAQQSLELYKKSEAAWTQSHGWGDVLGLALTEAEAWTLFSKGKRDQAIAQLKSAALFERDHPMYYADVLPRPTEEMLGDMLCRIDQPAAALAAYQAALKLAPNRLDSLLGASAAAAKSGNLPLSREYTAKVRAEGGLAASRP